MKKLVLVLMILLLPLSVSACYREENNHLVGEQDDLIKETVF
ncbi:hypothetical protein [Syntrophomonas erecta]